MHILQAGEPFALPGPTGLTISLLPLRGDVGGLTLRGFEYPLDEATLSFETTDKFGNILRETGG
jgi:thiamine pyrophosphokinase